MDILDDMGVSKLSVKCFFKSEQYGGGTSMCANLLTCQPSLYVVGGYTPLWHFFFCVLLFFGAQLQSFFRGGAVALYDFKYQRHIWVFY